MNASGYLVRGRRRRCCQTDRSRTRTSQRAGGERAGHSGGKRAARKCHARIEFILRGDCEIGDSRLTSSDRQRSRWSSHGIVRCSDYCAQTRARRLVIRRIGRCECGGQNVVPSSQSARGSDGRNLSASWLRCVGEGAGNSADGGCIENPVAYWQSRAQVRGAR